MYPVNSRIKRIIEESVHDEDDKRGINIEFGNFAVFRCEKCKKDYYALNDGLLDYYKF